MAAGDSVSDVQVKLMGAGHLTAELRMQVSMYALDYADERSAA